MRDVPERREPPWRGAEHGEGAVRRRTRLAGATCATLALGLLLSAAIVAVARASVSAEAERRLESEATTTAVITGQIVSQVEAVGRSLFTVVEVNGPRGEGLARAATPYFERGVLAGVAVLEEESGGRWAPVETLGAARHLHEVPEPPPSGTGSAPVVPAGTFGPPDDPLLGLAVGPAGGEHIVWLELPVSGLVDLAVRPLGRLDAARAIAANRVAIYADGTDEPESLVFATTGQVPVPEPRAERTLPFGSTRWHLVLSPRSPLLSGSEQALPWLLGGAGSLAALLAATAVEVASRRRSAVARKERRFRFLVQGSSDITALLDDAGRLAYVSPAVERLLGYEPEQLLDAPSETLVHPEDRPRLVAAIEGLSGSGRTAAVEHRVRHADGSWRHLETTVSPLHDVPEIGGVVLNSRDVTDRYEAEAARGRLAAIVEATSDLVVVADPDGTIAFANQAARTTLRAAEGGHLPALVTGASRARFADAVATALRTGEWTGELRVVSATGDELPVSSVALAHRDHTAAAGDFLAVVWRDLSERAALEEQLAHQAFHDPLTGLANRALLADRLQHALDVGAREQAPVSVVALDLDGFKAVNDSLGHDAGDQLLCTVAARLRRHLRAADTVARSGGDEFVLLLPGVSEAEAEQTARRVLEELRAPVVLADRELRPTASAGVTTGTSLAAPDLLRDADAAMYAAKSAGRNRALVFEASMHAATVERLELHADLQVALDRDELILEYQPLVELGSGGLVGVEALLRWDHPRRGLVPPREFVAVAEDTGLIGPIGRWVLHEACRQAAEWSRSRRIPLGVSVNVSVRQLYEPTFADDVASAVESSGVPPGLLTLEITETVLMSEPSRMADLLRRLRELGVRLALDDFGTGYSALSYLESFPIDVLKIDKSFVDGLERRGSARGLLAAIVALGEAMELTICAEGIESREQADILVRLGCSLGQGFWFARPTGPDGIAALLRRAGNGGGLHLPVDVPQPVAERA